VFWYFKKYGVQKWTSCLTFKDRNHLKKLVHALPIARPGKIDSQFCKSVMARVLINRPIFLGHRLDDDQKSKDPLPHIGRSSEFSRGGNPLFADAGLWFL
jgi:hypothetical protein